MIRSWNEKSDTIWSEPILVHFQLIMFYKKNWTKPLQFVDASIDKPFAVHSAEVIWLIGTYPQSQRNGHESPTLMRSPGWEEQNRYSPFAMVDKTHCVTVK